MMNRHFAQLLPSLHLDCLDKLVAKTQTLKIHNKIMTRLGFPNKHFIASCNFQGPRVPLFPGGKWVRR